MKVCVLASGSSGNSTYIESKESKILIDAGISGKRIIQSLTKLGLDLNELDGVFVSHEHTDHVKGLDRLYKNKVPVFLNRETFLSSNLNLNPNFFINNTTIKFKDLKITPQSVYHDAADPCGFKIENNGSVIGVFTDLGKANKAVVNTIKESDCLVWETNHDIDMLLNGRYPYHLKQRILSDKGHLSNIDAGLLVNEHSNKKLKTVFLAHISKNNNTHELAINTFSELTKEKKLNRILTHQKEETDLIKI